ncbi:MAG TPA: hypothetical protein VG388_06485 [Solirubrobacteraceae bacterium]|nr:hypothetical protein [Solirubrobacteraceae bacterium]
MSTSEQPSEEELRAAYEAEMKRLRVEQVLLESVVSLVNLGMRRTGLAPGTESERDPAQVHLAIESVRALNPIVEQILPEQAGPIRDAVSQLQLAYVKIGGRAPAEAGAPSTGAGAAEPAAKAGPGATAEPGVQGASGAPGAPPTPPAPEGPTPGEPGPAQRSGRLWIPGQ